MVVKPLIRLEIDPTGPDGPPVGWLDAGENGQPSSMFLTCGCGSRVHFGAPGPGSGLRRGVRAAGSRREWMRTSMRTASPA